MCIFFVSLQKTNNLFREMVKSINSKTIAKDTKCEKLKCKDDVNGKISCIKKQLGSLYKPELSLQVRLLARLLCLVDECSELRSEPGYEMVKKEYSREGNTRNVLNPLESHYLDVITKAQAAIKALGMNLDCKGRKDTTAVAGILDGFTPAD